jgi:hypothetical protein
MRRWWIAAIFTVGVAGTSAIGLGACDSDEADELLQCSDICSAFIDCTNSEVDLDDCVGRCEDQGSNTSPEFEGCEDCVDQNACESNEWLCSSECAAVIDQSTIDQATIDQSTATGVPGA